MSICSCRTLLLYTSGTPLLLTSKKLKVSSKRSIFLWFRVCKTVLLCTSGRLKLESKRSDSPLISFLKNFDALYQRNFQAFKEEKYWPVISLLQDYIALKQRNIQAFKNREGEAFSCDFVSAGLHCSAPAGDPSFRARGDAPYSRGIRLLGATHYDGGEGTSLTHSSYYSGSGLTHTRRAPFFRECMPLLRSMSSWRRVTGELIWHWDDEKLQVCRILPVLNSSSIGVVSATRKDVMSC